MDAAFLDTVRSEVKTALAELLDETRSARGTLSSSGAAQAR